MSHVSCLQQLPPHRRPGHAGRLLAFTEGKLTTNEQVLLIQEIMETGHILELPDQFLRAAIHYCGNGFCTANGRMLQ